MYYDTRTSRVSEIWNEIRCGYRRCFRPRASVSPASFQIARGPSNSIRATPTTTTRAARPAHKADLDGATRDHTQAIKLNPRFAVAWHDRGAARHAKGDLDGAIADYNRGIELAPNIAAYYAKRGLALLLQGKEAEARRDFDRCLRWTEA
ncbi:MAG: tetratricopeptide repeat protein [Blastocatellia bacterium]